VTPGRVRLLLALSVALNLFLGGLIAGAWFTEGRERDRPAPRRLSYLAAAEQLDPEDGARLRALLEQKAADTRPRLRALRAARREAEAAMAAPRYDPEAVRRALARAQAEELALRREIDDAVIAFALTLEPEERAALAPVFRKRGRDGRGAETRR